MSPDNALMLLLPFLIFFHSFLTLMFANSALYRYPTCDLSSGNFKCDSFYYLWEEKLTSSMVKGQFSCAFLCVGEPRCYSFNVAEYPDSNGLYLCELLVTDKYRATGKLFANATSHHFSPWISSPYIFGVWKVFLLIEIVLFVERSRSLSSLHVKVLLVWTVVSVSLSMSGTPITVTVNLYSVELTANEVV